MFRPGQSDSRALTFNHYFILSLQKKNKTIKEQRYVCVGALCNTSLGGGCGNIRKREIFLEGLVSEQS